MLEPRSRTVDPQLLLESLYKLTDLEVRFPLNLNVLDANRTPGVMSLRQALTAWLAFQIEVLLNRSREVLEAVRFAMSPEAARDPEGPVKAP